MQIYNNILDLIGHTPLVRINAFAKHHKLQANLIAKVESFNPGGSVKDRVASAILKDALKRNLINQDTTIIEPTSGNTGIGLALTCASLGLKLVIVMPDTMSIERRSLLRAYGANLVLTQGALGMKGAIDTANKLLAQTANSYMPSQFDNLVNPNIHYLTTGPEIYQDTDGKVDIFVSGVGTGGTISGVGKYLKEQNPKIKVIAVEPKGSPFLSEGRVGPHKIQGIGAGFIPKTLDVNIYDEIVTVSDVDAYEVTSKLAHLDGLLVGISSGAVIYAASQLAKRKENFNKNIVVLLADTGERYLSTQAFLG